jgi:hypothetical protein
MAAGGDLMNELTNLARQAMKRKKSAASDTASSECLAQAPISEAQQPYPTVLLWRCPHPPILPGWLVAYRGPDSRLRGGSLEPEHGRVVETRYTPGIGWSFVLADGTALAVSAVVSVGRTDKEGRLIAAWTVREHGYDG